ncbi:MAG: type II toxin-antitoxin system prevent-host-death family antitoxin [Solirubrobacterales bacterium]|nr:type II toxin-antitoxin system prevent-host-death family antitoxin [Solirubrobacterales bacterium]
MTEKTISASKFKAECLGLLDTVAQTGRELVITKRGKPVARVVAVDDPPSLRGSVKFLVSDEELIAPLGETWNTEIE